MNPIFSLAFNVYSNLLIFQLVAVVLGSQEVLSMEKRRSALLNILGGDILAESAKQLKGLRRTHRHLFKEVSTAFPDALTSENTGHEDDEWMEDLEIPDEASHAPQLDEEEDGDEEEEEEEDDENEESENPLSDDDLQLDVDEVTQSELATAEAMKSVVKSCVVAVPEKVYLPSKSVRF